MSDYRIVALPKCRGILWRSSARFGIRPVITGKGNYNPSFFPTKDGWSSLSAYIVVASWGLSSEHAIKRTKKRLKRYEGRVAAKKAKKIEPVAVTYSTRG